MIPLRGLDLAVVVAENAGAMPRGTNEDATEVIHALVLMHAAGEILLGARNDSPDQCWIGKEVGTFPLSVELVDALDAEWAWSDGVHGVIDDGEVKLQVRHSVRAEDLSVASFLRIVEDNLSHLYRLRSRIEGTPSDTDDGRAAAPGRRAAVEAIVSEFLVEWRRILRHAGHRTNLSVPTPRDGAEFGKAHFNAVTVSATGWYVAGETVWPLHDSWDLLEISTALESVSAPDFVALREIDGGVLACGAVGGIAFAIQDDADLSRAVALALGNRAAPSILDLVGGYLTRATKIGHILAPNHLLPGEAWHRPIFVRGSAERGQIQVKTKAASGKMVVDTNVSRAATALLAAPESAEAERRLNASLDGWFTGLEAYARDD